MDSKTNKPMTFDDILGLIGEIGLYQIIAISMICYAILPEALDSMIYVFGGAKLDHWCAVNQWASSTDDCLTLGPADLEGYRDCIYKFRNASIPQIADNGELSYSQCTKYDSYYPDELPEDFNAGHLTNSTITCNEGWEYSREQYISTIVSDFDLVCDYKHLAGTTQTVFFAGYLVGSWLSGSVSDVIGRYYTFFLSVALEFIAGMVLSFSPSIWFFCLFRFLVGVANISIYLIGYVMVTELVGPSKRIYSGVAASISYSVGYMLLALLAFVIRDWRNLQRICSLSLLPIVTFMFFLPESPRWLMDRKRYDKAEAILRKVAKLNRTVNKLPSNLSEILSKQSPEKEGNSRPPAFIDLFKTPRLRTATLSLFLLWFVNSLVYFALSLNTAELGGNDYLTFFLSGLVEVPACLLCIPVLESPLGRRYSMLVTMLSIGISCLFSVFLHEDYFVSSKTSIYSASTAKGTFLTVSAMVGKFFASSSFVMAYVFTAEVFPTTVRGIGVGSCSTVARFGNMSAPLLLMLSDSWKPLPFLVCGSLAVLVSGAILLLPETRNRDLPATIEDVEESTEGKSKAKMTVVEVDGSKTNKEFQREDKAV